LQAILPQKKQKKLLFGKDFRANVVTGASYEHNFFTILRNLIFANFCSVIFFALEIVF